MKLQGGKTKTIDKKILETDRFQLWAETGIGNVIIGFVILNKKRNIKQVVAVINNNFEEAWKKVGIKIKPLL